MCAEAAGSGGGGATPARRVAFLYFAAAFVLALGAHAAGLVGRAAAVAAGFALALVAVALGLGLAAGGARRWLWLIRRKLVLSYVFIAIVPLLLVTLVFALVAYLGSGHLVAYLAAQQLGGVATELSQAAEELAGRLETAAREAPDMAALRQGLGQVTDLAAAAAPLRGRFTDVAARALVVSSDGSDRWVPPGLDWQGKPGRPAWLEAATARTAFVFGPETGLELRSAQARPAGAFTVYVQVALPFNGQTLDALASTLGMRLRVVEPLGSGEAVRVLGQSRGRAAGARGLRALPIFGVFSVPSYTEAGRHHAGDKLVVIEQRLDELARQLWDFRAENRLLVLSLLVLVGSAFVAIEGASLWAGIALARSITGSIHEMFVGTRRIEQGDLSYRFPVRSDDQLGALARSFNRMAEAVERQVAESAERERLEEELRIGRRIQQSLLPRKGWSDGRFEIAAMSLPAREVGGDYYDYFELGEERLGLLVADVSGKGTEAAFYMAEVKGIMLALARAGGPPAAVLARANAILGASLDRRTFVTMTYAILDSRRGRLLFGRAGHNPLLHLAAAGDDVRSRCPAGLALGLDRTGRFAGLLAEEELELAPGDLVLLYTDGVTDTMAADGELYGEERLRRALLAARGRDAEGVRDALVAELRRFAAAGPPHDDLTVIVLRAL